MKYLKRDGTTVNEIPNPLDYVKDEEDLSVGIEFILIMHSSDHEIIDRCYCGSSYPNNNVIKWHLLNSGAAYVTVEKTYELV